MPVDETRMSLKHVLEEKSTEELRALLVMDYSEDENDLPDVDYIRTILEVIREREKENDLQERDIESARTAIHEYIQAIIDEEEDTGTIQEHSHDHPPINHQKTPHRRPHFMRYIVIAAVITIFIGTTASAFGFDFFQAIAKWTAETFSFLRLDDVEVPSGDTAVLEPIKTHVLKYSDLSCIPNWTPVGSKEGCEVSVQERKDRIIIRQSFLVEEDEFTIRIIIHDTIPETYTTEYQKDDENAVTEYEARGITHYIVSNNDTSGVFWTNDNIEGFIQGALSAENLERMVDSIYN